MSEASMRWRLAAILAAAGTVVVVIAVLIGASSGDRAGPASGPSSADVSAQGAGRVIIVSSIAGVVSGPAFGPYSMTKHALEAMGKAMRAELSSQGIDVTLLNPGPYLTGFNDRMADSMWEWFGDKSLNAPATPLFQMMRELVTNGQMDPAEVVTKMVELTEAETTTENNFVPPEILAQMTAQVGN